MRAVFVKEHGGPDALQYGEVETPEPGYAEVLVRTTAIGVNHFDHDIREGISGVRQKLPHVPGIEGVGAVAKLGPGVTRLSPGERVAVHFFQQCGMCRNCLSGLDNICLRGERVGLTRWGSYAEYMVCREISAIPIPEGLEDDIAAASLICMSTAWHMTVTLGQVRAGETVLVNAAGSGVGTSAIQVAKLHGATVIASAGSDAKLDRARELGADMAVNYHEERLDEACSRLTGGRGVDLVIESVGGEVLTRSIQALASNGRLVTCGAHAGETVRLDVIELFRKHIRLQGSHYASRAEVEHVFRLLRDGKLKPVIHGKIPLSNAKDAAVRIADRNFFGKILLDPAA